MNIENHKRIIVPFLGYWYQRQKINKTTTIDSKYIK